MIKHLGMFVRLKNIANVDMHTECRAIIFMTICQMQIQIQLQKGFDHVSG